jgi:hypothetical protein
MTYQYRMERIYAELRELAYAVGHEPGTATAAAASALSCAAQWVAQARAVVIMEQINE